MSQRTTASFIAGFASVWLLGGIIGLLEVAVGNLPQDVGTTTEADVYLWLAIGLGLMLVAVVIDK